MNQPQRIAICASADLIDGGNGVRFPLTFCGQPGTGFVVRYDGVTYAYVNRCAHVPIELDWREGEFFESGGLYLMCATHGALYEPETGHCVGGPCRGGRLHPVTVIEDEQTVFWQPDGHTGPPAEPISPQEDPAI